MSKSIPFAEKKQTYYGVGIRREIPLGKGRPLGAYLETFENNGQLGIKFDLTENFDPSTMKEQGKYISKEFHDLAADLLSKNPNYKGDLYVSPGSNAGGPAFASIAYSQGRVDAYDEKAFTKHVKFNQWKAKNPKTWKWIKRGAVWGGIAAAAGVTGYMVYKVWQYQLTIDSETKKMSDAKATMDKYEDEKEDKGLVGEVIPEDSAAGKRILDGAAKYDAAAKDYQTAAADRKEAQDGQFWHGLYGGIAGTVAGTIGVMKLMYNVRKAKTELFAKDFPVGHFLTAGKYQLLGVEQAIPKAPKLEKPTVPEMRY